METARALRCRAAGNKIDTFLAYELTNCGLSSYSKSSCGDAPMESMTLNLTKFMRVYTERDAKIAGSPDTVGYDLLTMEKNLTRRRHRACKIEERPFPGPIVCAKPRQFGRRSSRHSQQSSGRTTFSSGSPAAR